MGKLYTKKSSEQKRLKELKPKAGTVKFLLNYSKALRVSEYGNMQFETFIN
ncbi:hypothetical protein ACW6QP_05020 [Salegentibacter sp. HM20]